MGLKSAWAYNNGKRMDRESMPKPRDKISFIGRNGKKRYAEYGNVKTYANKKQAKDKIMKLAILGYVVHMSEKWPYTIYL